MRSDPQISQIQAEESLPDVTEKSVNSKSLMTTPIEAV
jgi:hypothetical protein